VDLLLDLGHSRLKWACRTDGRLHGAGAAAWSAAVPDAFARLLGELPVPQRVGIAAAARGAPLDALRAAVQNCWGVTARVPAVMARCGAVRCGYTEPARLGFDRWAALIGAWARQPGHAAVVVDCGSAVTVDGLRADGQHLGGVIFPGLALMQDAFYARTGLPRDPAHVHADVAATVTADAVAGGARIAVLGGIELAVRRWCERLPGAQLWLTGGDAPALAADLPAGLMAVPHLVLEGLGRILDEEGA